MAYEGYLALGGVEIVNTERARGYLKTADCSCLDLNEACECDGLGDAAAALNGDQETSPVVYDYSQIEQAPWWDEAQPDISSRFFGVVGHRISGLYDSTRSAEVSQGITDGGIIGQQRRGTREVRVTALLLARGKDALSFGARWLDSALDPSACGRHGTGCGTADATFFTDCPEPREFHDPIVGEWTETARNLVLDPGPYQESSGDWSAAFGGATFEGLTYYHGRTRAHYLAGGDGEQYIGGSTSAGFSENLDPSKSYRATIEVSSERAGGSGNYRASISVATDVGVFWGPVTTISQINTGGGPVRLSVDIPAGATTAAVGVFPIASAGGNPQTDVNFYLGKKSLIAVDEGSDWFDGNSDPGFDSEGTQIVRYSWEGAEGDSVSVQETRTVEYQETDDEYLDRLEPVLRYLHDVGTVSGPIESEEYGSGDCWILEVEFTLASQLPYAYSRPVPIPISSDSTTVTIEDTAYNLMRFPEAAEGDGTEAFTAHQYTPRGDVSTDSLWSGSGTGEFSDVNTGTTNESYFQSNEAFLVRAVSSGEGNGQIVAEYLTSVPTWGGIFSPPVLGGNTASGTFWCGVSGDYGAEVSTLIVSAYLRAGGSTVSTTLIAVVSNPSEGMVIPFTGLEVPVGVDEIRFRAIGNASADEAGKAVRLYVDAAAVTVP